MTYCTTCGAKLVKHQQMGYNGNTGKPIYFMVCPTGLCYHTGCYHNYVDHPMNRWWNPNHPIRICTKCGHEEYPLRCHMY